MKKPKLLVAALCMVVAGIFVGVGFRMGADGYAAGWVFVLLGVLLSVCLYILGSAVIRYIADTDAPEQSGKNTAKSDPPDETLERLRSYGLHISEEDYRKLRRKIREENDTNGK